MVFTGTIGAGKMVSVVATSFGSSMLLGCRLNGLSISSEFIFMFIYTSYDYLKAQVYAHIRYWIYRGDFDEADANDVQDAYDTLRERLSSSLYELNHDYEFDNMVSLARYAPSFRDILEEVSPAYTSTIDDRGFFVYSVLCELFKKVFLDDFDEFRFILNRRMKKNEKV